MDGDQTTWHNFHRTNKNDYADGYAELMSSMKAWSHHNLHHRLVYFAINFKPSQFVNGKVSPGFYDAIEPDIVKVGKLN